MQVVLQPATLRLVAAATFGCRAGLIGYVAGSGDTSPRIWRTSADVELLDDEHAAQRRSRALSRRSSLGIRAYNTRDVLRAAHPRLDALRRARRHAGRAVQHHQSACRRSTSPIGPYPLEHRPRPRHRRDRGDAAGRRRADPLLRGPNRIDAADFVGWVQERGLYFAENWDDALPAALRAAPIRANRRSAARCWSPLRPRPLRVHRAVVLPAAARRRAGRLPPVRQPARAHERGAARRERADAARHASDRRRGAAAAARLAGAASTRWCWSSWRCWSPLFYALTRWACVSALDWVVLFGTRGVHRRLRRVEDARRARHGRATSAATRRCAGRPSA